MNCDIGEATEGLENELVSLCAMKGIPIGSLAQ